MTTIIPFKRFSARQRFRTTKVKGFAAIPTEINRYGCSAIGEADRERRLFLVAHDLSRALDEQCAQRLREINGMRSSPTREYECHTPTECLSGDDLVGLDNRITSAAYGLRKLGQPAVADTLGGHYLPWLSKWDALRYRAACMKKKRGTLPTKYADVLLDEAEALIYEISRIIWGAADAANITLYPRGVQYADGVLQFFTVRQETS